jgi:hypothetical protein
MESGQNVSCHWESDGKILGHGLELEGIILQSGIHNISFIVDDNVSDPINDTIVIVVTHRNITQGPEMEGIDENDGDQRIFTPLFIISLLIILFMVVTVVVLIRREIGVTFIRKKYKPAPQFDENTLRSDPMVMGPSRSTTELPLLPPKEAEKVSFKDRLTRFKGVIQKKANRVVLDQRGERIEPTVSRDTSVYSPYSSYNTRTSKGMERISEYNSFYIRPENPYRRFR